MKENELTAAQKVGKGILMVIGAPIVMIGLVIAIYVTLFTSLFNSIRNHGNIRKISRPRPEEPAAVGISTKMVPRLAR
ncbi:MAG TPA: hypothetical protein PKN87_08050 [Syntrophomonadaceae bacterium]|nr:hypothetical protein [Syntrophomonadaceae bacterium]HPR94521.1 hypothetical protein [Syntrophomonadaceae bacterium]